MGQVTSNINNVASNIKSYFSPTNECKKPEDGEDLQPKESFPVLQRPKLLLNTPRGQDSTHASHEWSILDSPDVVTPRQAIKRSFPISPIKLPATILEIFSPKRPRLEEEFLDFPFLVEKKTMNYINKSKVIFILRGLPGSGKTTLADAIERKLDSIEVCSADNFFMKDGVYVFDGEQLSEAHAQCQKDAIKAVQNQSNVVIDNTNIRLWEMKFYLNLAKEYNYVPIIVEPRTPWKFDMPILAQKNKHSLDEEKLQWKHEGFQELEPVYYGWFLNERDESFLSDAAYSWLQEAFSIKEFIEDFSWHTGIQTFDCIENWFKKIGSSKILHCTSKYTAKGKSPGAMAYMQDENVRNSLGKVFEIEVIGFVITPRTFGARLKLSSNQMSLWAADDEEAIPETFWTIGNNSVETEPSDERHQPMSSEIEKDHPMVTEDEGTSSVNGHTGESPMEEDSASLLANGEESGGVSPVEEEKAAHLEGQPLTNGVAVEEPSEMAIDTAENGSKEPIEAQETPCNGSMNDEMKDPDTLMNGSSTDANGIEQETTQLEHVDVVTIEDTPTNTSDDFIIPSTPNGTDSVNGEPPSTQGEEKLSEESPTLKLDLSFSSSRSVSSSPIKRKPPRKGAPSGIPIPPNNLPLSESISALTCRVIPQDASDCCRYNPTSGLGSRAHITIACGQNESPVTTGLDLIFAVQNEKLAKEIPSCEAKQAESVMEESSQSSSDSTTKDTTSHQNVASDWPLRASIPKGTLIGYGNGLWVIYPEEKIVTSSLFASYQ